MEIEPGSKQRMRANNVLIKFGDTSSDTGGILAGLVMNMTSLYAPVYQATSDASFSHPEHLWHDHLPIQWQKILGSQNRAIGLDWTVLPLILTHLTILAAFQCGLYKDMRTVLKGAVIDYVDLYTSKCRLFARYQECGSQKLLKLKFMDYIYLKCLAPNLYPNVSELGHAFLKLVVVTAGVEITIIGKQRVDNQPCYGICSINVSEAMPIVWDWDGVHCTEAALRATSVAIVLARHD
ncbi:hypothetical protein Ancab_022546 [Ancistrocladus abbreviatus]